MDIPGFFYDPVKKKYFKIQASGTAPASAAYSSQDVKRRRARDQATELKELDLARQKGHARRFQALNAPLCGGLLDREFSRGPAVIDHAWIIAGGMIAHGRLPTPPRFSSCSDPLFDIYHRPDLGDGISEAWTQYDDQLYAVRVNTDNAVRRNRYDCVDICRKTNEMDISSTRYATIPYRQDVYGRPGTSTSLTMHQQSQRLAMTWLSGASDSGMVVTPLSGIVDDGGDGQPTVLGGPGTARGMEANIYSSAAAPSSSSILFAFGTSHGIYTMSKEDLSIGWLPATKSQPPITCTKDVFALEFLTDNASILLSGGRSGLLHIADLRLPATPSSQTANTITHPSTITHICQLDSHRILVAGLNSTLCQYDLRFRKDDDSISKNNQQEGTARPSSRVRKKQRQCQDSGTSRSQALRSFSNYKHTRSILTYSGYYNHASIQVGLDIDLESGIIAVAQEASHELYSEPVQLFSLHGGQKLRSLVVKRVESRLDEQDRRERGLGWGDGDQARRTVKCLKWARDGVGKMKSLYVGTEGGIRRFAWADREDSDE